jgi:transposase
MTETRKRLPKRQPGRPCASLHLRAKNNWTCKPCIGVRDRAVGERTSLMNQLRAILLERGVIVPQGRAKLRLRLAELMRQGIEQLSSRIRLLIEDMLARWQALDERIAAFDAEFSAEAKQNEAMRRLTSIPGIGALNATALVAAVGDAQTFARARNLAAWLGLVPRQATTGGKPRLLGITKRGSKYLRKMLIQGARAALPTLSRSNTRLGGWLRGLLARAHSNTVVVALAAKMARIEPQAIANFIPRPFGLSCATAQRSTGFR